MPTERQAVCSAFGRLAITGPTSQAAANSSAVLPRITARYSSSVVAVFLAAASCITSPSAIVAAAADRMRSEEHTSELQSLAYLVCRLLLEKKKAWMRPDHRGKRTMLHTAPPGYALILLRPRGAAATALRLELFGADCHLDIHTHICVSFRK